MTTQNALATMPDDARLWIYGFERPFSSDLRQRVVRRLKVLVDRWVSHGAPVVGAYEIVEDRFILLAGFCSDGISGCSTDSSVQVIKEIEADIGIPGLNRSLVFYRDEGGTVRALERQDFHREVKAGRIDGTTVVFDTVLQTVADLRADRFETTFAQSWHARAFPRSSED